MTKTNQWVGKQTKLRNVIQKVRSITLIWVSNLAKMTDKRWTKCTT